MPVASCIFALMTETYKERNVITATRPKFELKLTSSVNGKVNVSVCPTRFHSPLSGAEGHRTLNVTGPLKQLHKVGKKQNHKVSNQIFIITRDILPKSVTIGRVHIRCAAQAPKKCRSGGKPLTGPGIWVTFSKFDFGQLTRVQKFRSFQFFFRLCLQ